MDIDNNLPDNILKEGSKTPIMPRAKMVEIKL